MSLYAGSARHYLSGRMPYPAELAEAVRDEIRPDGKGRLLDVGCGPGSLTALLAPLFGETVGVDAEPEMIEAARSRYPEIGWRVLRAEELPAGLGRFDVVTFAQSFHWMDQPAVAAAVRDHMLAPDGVWLHVGASTHRGLDGDEPLGHPRPPWAAIDALTTRYLGPGRPAGTGRSGEEDVLRAAGFAGPVRRIVPRGQVVVRGADEIADAVLSLSSSTPGRLGDALPRYLDDLRSLLHHTSPTGQFAERVREIELVFWRLPHSG